ncbi:tyrosine--tRNA ligase [bacterium]|nr:tyrosine--tRNA ligase [bacterium]
MISAQEQLRIIKKGTIDIFQEGELLQKLENSVKTGKPLKIKLGADPTAPDLHLGHTVVLHKMRQFQDLGHEVIFLIGDFTSLIGDPTGKSETRKPLTPEQVKKSAESYTEQIFKVLDPEKTRIVYNSSWMGQMSSYDMIKLASRYSVARMLERDDFKKRFREGSSIAIHEFLYPLVQAYDSVVLESDVELGGSDQLFNLLLGRTLQKEFGLPSQIAITMPILEGLDAKNIDGVLTGKKMSKSLGNYVGIAEEPSEIFGKILSITDELMWRYYDLLSFKSIDEIENLKKGALDGSINPKNAKVMLAKEIVERFHGSQAAEKAAEDFELLFKKREIPEDIEEINITIEEDSISISRVLVNLNFASTNSEATRLVKQGGVSINGEKITDFKYELDKGFSGILKSGKKNFCKVNII